MKLKCRKELDYLVRCCNRRITDAKVAGTEKAWTKCRAWIERQDPVSAEKPDRTPVQIRARLNELDQLALHVYLLRT